MRFRVLDIETIPVLLSGRPGRVSGSEAGIGGRTLISSSAWFAAAGQAKLSNIMYREEEPFPPSPCLPGGGYLDGGHSHGFRGVAPVPF